MYRFSVKPLLTLSISLLFALNATVSGQSQINWVSIEDLEKLSQIEKKKIIVDVHTSWCSWCRKMDKMNFQDPAIAKYINNNYYAVRFDAETKSNVFYNGKSYKFIKTGNKGYNELALELTKGKLSYPSIVFMDENLKVIQPIQGYIEPEKFEIILSYFSQDRYRDTPWVKYEKNYIQGKNFVRER